MAALVVCGTLAGCGGSHAIKPGETITLDRDVTVEGRTVTSVIISPTVRTTE